MSEVFIGRQPIFDNKKNLFAYELLFRNGMDNCFPTCVDGDMATSSLLSSTFFTAGVDSVSGGSLCFVNFPKDLLLKDVAYLFPKENIVVEILEDIAPTPEIIETCEKLSAAGYKIALDDFVYSDAYIPLLEIADIVKIDFWEMTLEEVQATVDIIKPYNCTLLAEKIETYEEFEIAKKMGFKYHQGYFFAKPEVVKRKDLSSGQQSLLRLAAELNKPDSDIDQIEQIVKLDVGISHKLLNFLNSSYFSLVSPVKSIRQAITFLGQANVKQFLTLIVTSSINKNKPLELAKLSVTRAIFLHKIGESLKDIDQEELFLLGLFSLIPAMLDCDMVDVVKRLPLSDNVKDAMATQTGDLFPFLQLATAYEEFDMDKLAGNKWLGLVGTDVVIASYMDAIKVADKLFTE